MIRRRPHVLALNKSITSNHKQIKPRYTRRARLRRPPLAIVTGITKQLHSKRRRASI